MTQRLREETFDFPAPEELSFILALRLASIAAVRSDQFDTITSGQLRVQRVAIVGAIRGKTSRRNARHVDGERSSPSRRMRSLAKALSRRAQVARSVSCLKAAVAGRWRRVLLWQIAPAHSSLHHPEDAVGDAAVIKTGSTAT